MHPSVIQLIETARMTFSDVLPSVWAERTRIMPQGSSHPGPFSYEETPYTREIIDCLHPSCPAKKIAWMKAAQIGGSAGVIENGIAYTISERPMPILHTVGHDSLIEEAIRRIDDAIDQCKLNNLIRRQNTHRKGQKTGNTDSSKEFAGGPYLLKPANHKSFAQFSAGVGMIDDYEKMVAASKKSGSIENLILARFTSYYNFMKLFFISTPENAEDSNIEKVFKKGDQRYYNIPCPCCHDFITLEWEVENDGVSNTEDKRGIYFKRDNHGHLITSSVGYICQKCAGFFTDKNKKQLLNDGHWRPTAVARSEDYRSYHTNALYAANFMFPWTEFAQQWIDCNPLNQPRIESDWQTFNNLVLAKTFAKETVKLKSNDIQQNVRPYDVGIIPESLSLKDGNGRIVAITCVADMNGLCAGINSDINDARLDYEIVAWAENGANYSIKHGSIGTFIPLEGNKKEKVDRLKWSYEMPNNKDNTNRSVWPEFEKVLNEIYYTDTGQKRKIFISGLDTGHFTTKAYAFLDKTNCNIHGLKGVKEDELIAEGVDVKYISPAKERPGKLYNVQVSKIKDDLKDYMHLKWISGHDDEQPPFFMNFPKPSDGLYTYPGFFQHYESEHRVYETIKKTGKKMLQWKKVNSWAQNHFWDCRVYGHALCSLLVHLVGIEAKQKNFTWKDYVNLFKGQG
jgi:phage terminase large subunit GpA-like protein